MLLERIVDFLTPACARTTIEKPRPNAALDKIRIHTHISS
jgi:hypothetical protein